MADRLNPCGLSVNALFYNFIVEEVLPGTGLQAEQFWQALSRIVDDLGPRNAKLLQNRNDFQVKIDTWHQRHQGTRFDAAKYRNFLCEIGYVVPSGPDFEIATENVDSEIAATAGPQLVVPVSNARFALNAANARWGSLFDALYGTNAMGEGPTSSGHSYDTVRGHKVVDYVCRFLDQVIPLRAGSYRDVKRFILSHDKECRLTVELISGETTSLVRPDVFVGYTSGATPTSILLVNHQLHIELQIDPQHQVGRTSPGFLKDVVLESAVTTIQDCEDSVAAVTADDKVIVYRNWLGLMKGTLGATFEKNGVQITRQLSSDRLFKRPNGEALTLPGRSLLLVRNVGHLMTTDAVLDSNAAEIPEGFLDALVTSACALHDLNGKGQYRNSRTGSIYIVKPKMHGPEEVTLTCDLFEMIEKGLGLARNTIKVGIMDEERRTTVNLKECIRQARERLVFINTGFLDRTGDEIHTSMCAGAFLPKEAIKQQPWIAAYENQNVEIGLQCKLPGRAQIGKGMWPKPDEMKQMMDTKSAHPQAGATTAWVPSPTAATLHSMHYHFVDVQQRQSELAARPRGEYLNDLLTIPILGERRLSREEVQAELDNNVQSILGYVVRWIDQGIGCSKVPDINNVALMEDRATLRISSQHIANWLRHGVCDVSQVMETLRRMAEIVDGQNASDPAYKSMSPRFDDNLAFRAARDLIFAGCEQPNGYTEPILHFRRRQAM